MSLKSPTGNTYNLCLLDTNVISEIIKRPRVEGRGYFERFYKNFITCFTVYSLIELRRNTALFKDFVNWFAMPCCILKPVQILLEDEKESQGNLEKIVPVMDLFLPVGSKTLEAFIDGFFSLKAIKKIESNWKKDENETLKVWLSRKKNFIPTKPSQNARDAERYVKEAGLQTLIQLFPKWAQELTENGRSPNIDYFPSLKVSLYSQYYRLYDPNWKPEPQEVTDVQIISASPYMEAVITEAFQAEILKKVKNKVNGLEEIEILTLRDIRYKSSP